MFLVPFQKKGWKIDHHVSNLKTRGFLFQGVQVHPYAGSRTHFRDKKSSDFSGEIFPGEEFLPKNSFLGQKIRSILSNQVILWYGSRAVGCPLGREFSAKTCSLLGNEGTPPDFEGFFLEKRP